MADFEHLRIEREPLENDRRTIIRNIPRTPRSDLRSHGQRLANDLTRSCQFARQQQTSRPGNFVLKIRYTGLLDISHLDKHGVEFISQEDNNSCVVFVDEVGLAVFSDHLQRLGLDDAELTYKQILEAIEGIDNWKSEDRKSWALKKKGMPDTEQFVFDVELWPVAVAHHPDRLRVCEAFERWLVENGIRRAGRLLNNYPSASANLLRALLVNHANMLAEIEGSFPDGMKEAYKEAASGRDASRNVAGYGLIDETELFRCSQNAVVLMAEDKIDNNAHHFFELPLPAEFLRSQRAAREVRVTLAYCPAVRTTRIDYVATKMHFRLVKDASLEALQRHFNHDTQSETNTRNDDATGNRDISAELRSKSTVQSSTWRMRQRNPAEKWFVVVTRQDRDWGEALSLEQEDYALVVTVTDRENENAELYTQISQRIEQQLRERVRV